MKTEIKIHEPEVQGFPALYQTKDGAIVLMSSDSVGICLVAGDVNPVGDYSNAWAMDEFTKITSDVTITFKAGA